MDFVRLADDLLAEFGADFTVTRPFGPSRDGNGHEVPGGKTPLTPSVRGVIQQFRPFEMDGTHILSGDVRLVCDNKQRLEVGDLFDIGGHTWRVVEPGPVCPHGGVVVCHKAQLRRV